jgi:hypothetical protein
MTTVAGTTSTGASKAYANMPTTQIEPVNQSAMESDDGKPVIVYPFS